MIEMQQVFGSRKRRKYGLASNMIYNLRACYDFDKRLFFYQLLPVVPEVAAGYLGSLIPSEVVRALGEGWSVGEMAVHICVLAVVMLLCNMITQGMLSYVMQTSNTLALYFSKKCFRKIMNMDYHLLEGVEEQKLIGNAWQAMRTNFNFYKACESIPTMGAAIMGVVFYGILIGRKSIILVLLMLFSVSVSMGLLSFARKKHGQYHAKLSRYAKEIAYINRQSLESGAGKDIRIYRMLDFFMKKYDEGLEGMSKTFGIIHDWYMLRSAANALVGFMVDMLAWGYLLYMLVGGKITTAEFVLYLGLINGFGSYLENLIRSAMGLAPMSVAISYIREFLELDNQWKGTGEKESGALTVELKGVSYTYPSAKEPTLKDINLTIRQGEKLALIGLNGAGKTTLVKLICGFYHPTGGEIYVNGRPVTDYDRDKYYEMVSVLFQDTTILPLTLDMNITGQLPEEIDRKRLNRALELAGFLDKYNSLPKKGETLLVREVNKESVDFSGGERQKLFFARALYKNGGLMILDEPTAALDPIAENELYEHFAEAAADRTTVYISHRLSSTKFCDRIVLLEHGRIIEEGTHDLLMEAGGRYAELFEIQSRYYQSQERLKARSEAMGDEYVETKEEGVFDEKQG